MSTPGATLVLSSSDLDDRVAVGNLSTSYYHPRLVQGNAEAFQAIAGETPKRVFEELDPPPTEMTLAVDTRFLDLSIQSFNNDMNVYLSQYILDCVWRDAEDPREKLTANAGTSISRRVKLYLYAGDPSSTETVRLLSVPSYRDGSGQDPDFYIYRDQHFVNEKAHNPYHPVQDLSSDLYFENQFTQQSEVYSNAGLFLGKLSSQALRVLRSTARITVRWESDRHPQHPSPFWYNRFLVGSSVWDPATKAYDVQPPGTQRRQNYERLGNVHLLAAGGPYVPLTLYTLASPINLSVAPFINDSDLLNVRDPPEGEVHPLNHPEAKLHVSQLAVAGTTDLAQVQTVSVPPLAPSDEDAFRVPLVDAGADSAIDVAFAIHERTSNAFPSRYGTGDGQCALHYPNGAWRGQPLPAGNTRVDGFLSPFPWEQRLTAHQLAVLNETQAYNAEFRYQVLDASQYLFMDPGTAWNEQARAQGNSVVNDVTVGERSLQFDFGVGRTCLVNKFQLSFPRSQEQHQPYRVQASLQKAYRGSADTPMLSRVQTLWFGGVQFESLSGSRANSQAYKYLNTHSQSSTGLRGSHTTLWDVAPRLAASAAVPFAPPALEFETDPTATRGRPGVVRVPAPDGAGGSLWYRGRPNDRTPALDFLRQEFGPFAQGATLADLKEPSLCKAWAFDGATANAEPVASAAASARTFFDLVDYLASPVGVQALGYKVYVQTTTPLWTPQESLASQGAAGWRFLMASVTGDRLVAAEDPYLWTFQTDDGWARQDGAGARSWTCVVAAAATSDVVMACANSASQLYRTEDFGATWAPVAQSPTTLWKGFAIAADGRTGFAVAENGPIYRYRSSGGRVNTVATYPDEWFVDVAYAANGGTVVAITDEWYGKGVIVSTNDGGVWTRRAPSNAVLNNTDETWVSVAVAPEGDLLVLAPGTGFLAQATLGSTGSWTYASIGPSSGWNYYWVDVAVVTPTSGSREIFATTDNGLLFKGVLVSGSTWSWTNAGRVQIGLAERAFLEASSDGSRIILAYENGNVFISYNKGASWISQASILPSGVWWRAVAISADGTKAVAAVEGGYLYVGTVGSSNTAWTQVVSTGERDWTAAGVSEDGQTIYAGTYYGFLWGSTDGGITWERDVSPVASNETWAGIAVRNNRGFAVSDGSGKIFQINLDSPPDPTPDVTTVLATTTTWGAIDCSRDAEVVVAVPRNGLIQLSVDNGETWSALPALGSHPWTSVAVSGDGRFALAVAQDGSVARGTTADASSRLDTWTVTVTTYAWTGVDVSDDFSTILATTNAGEGIFVSTDGGLSWAVDGRLAASDQALPWACVAVSGDGAVVAAGAEGATGNLYILDAGQAWNQLTLTAGSRALAQTQGPKIIVKDPAFPATFLQSNTPTDGNLVTRFSASVYEFFYQRHAVYRVDALQVPNPSASALRSSETYKAYRRPDGNVVFTTDNPVPYILEAIVGGQRLVAKDSDGLYYLIHPWYTNVDSKTELVTNPSYTKYILATMTTTQTANIVVSANASTSNVYVSWNGSTVVATLPDAAHANVQQLNLAFQTAMDAHKLYLEHTGNLDRKYYVRFEPNAGEALRLVVENPPRGASLPPGYQFPANAGSAWPYTAPEWPALEIAQVEGDRFGTVVGFDRGTYPPASFAGAVGDLYQKAPDFIPSWATLSVPSDAPSFNHAYQIYPEMYELRGSLGPLPDYIVKETYYFAPKYDQYDTKQSTTIDGFAAYQPSIGDFAQKMVNPSLAVGQSFGVGFGSFLYDQDNATSPNQVYTRGPGNHMKLFSFRPMTQLFSFETNSGFLRDKTGTATAQATFTNVVEAGRLANVLVSAQGAKYPGKDTTTAYLHPTLDWEEQGMYYDEATGRFADTSMFLLDQVAPIGNLATRHASIAFDMEEDPDSEPKETFTASTKTPLRRSAEFQLHFRSQNPGDAARQTRDYF
jgi:hypothetical protein